MRGKVCFLMGWNITRFCRMGPRLRSFRQLFSQFQLLRPSRRPKRGAQAGCPWCMALKRKPAPGWRSRSSRVSPVGCGDSGQAVWNFGSHPRNARPSNIRGGNLRLTTSGPVWLRVKTRGGNRIELWIAAGDDTEGVALVFAGTARTPPRAVTAGAVHD